MSTRAWRFRIEDILQALAGIAEDIEGMDYEAFSTDRKTRNSVARELEILGEAAYPLISWHLMRNIIAHEYFGINWQIAWETINTDLPLLVPLLQSILDEQRL